MSATLPKTKNLIQNIVIIVAMSYVFGTAGIAYFAPDLITNDQGAFSEFQQITLDNSSILIVVIIAGAIVAIKLDKRDSSTEKMVTDLIAALKESKSKDG